MNDFLFCSFMMFKIILALTTLTQCQQLLLALKTLIQCQELLLALTTLIQSQQLLLALTTLTQCQQLCREEKTLFSLNLAALDAYDKYYCWLLLTKFDFYFVTGRHYGNNK